MKLSHNLIPLCLGQYILDLRHHGPQHVPIYTHVPSHPTAPYIHLQVDETTAWDNKVRMFVTLSIISDYKGVKELITMVGKVAPLWHRWRIRAQGMDMCVHGGPMTYAQDKAGRHGVTVPLKLYGVQRIPIN